MFPRAAPGASASARGLGSDIPVEDSSGPGAVNPSNHLPPPPPRTGSSGPHGRRLGHRPPSLNTTLAYAHGQAQLPLTPALVTPSSLSSPFTLSNSNPNTSNVLTSNVGPGSNPASRGVSPAAHRLSGNFTNMAYNPQEWAGGRQQTVDVRTSRDCYGEPLQTPPPPYTIPPDQRHSTPSTLTRNQNHHSPDVSRTTTPVAQETGASESGLYTRPKPTIITTNSRQSHDLRRTSHMNAAPQEYNPASTYQQYRPQSSQSGHAQGSSSSGALSFQSNARASHDGAILPPPPPRNTPPAPVNAVSVQTDPIARLSYGRRSNSAGPTPTAGPSAPRPLRTLSGGIQPDSHEWAQGMPLPGPPSMPPPLAHRSRSASAHTDIPTSSESGTRSRPPRLAIRNSNLTPIPATPNSIASGASARPMPFPLRIDTGMGTSSGKAPAQVLPIDRQSDHNRLSQSEVPALARRSAVRGPAARSSQPLATRSRSKSQSGRSDTFEPPSTTLSNNPWASALEQARSPQDETLPESSVLPTMGDLLFTGGQRSGKTHTPPATPSAQAQKGTKDQTAPAAKVLPTPPLSQKPLLSANSVTNPAYLEEGFSQSLDDFTSHAMQRHLAFLQQEQEAASDLDRLNLFMLYMQQESLIRKERYLSAFQSEDFDLSSAREMLFDGHKVRRASTRENLPIVDTTMDSVTPSRVESGWWKDYKPALSPIASMDYDEMSSRGRAPGRWWESQTGSQTDGQGSHVVRSKRESKYMSLSKKLLQDMETSGDMEPLPEHSVWVNHDAYPDEKGNPETFGVYDNQMMSPPLTSNSYRRTPKPSQLDISRFITLPPPYPRHHPAVNNSHPDLTEYRSTVRLLSDLSDARSRQKRHGISVEAMRQDRRNRVAEIRQIFRANIASQIAEGSLSYAEAAEAEKSIKEQEAELERQGLQAEFDTLQDVVINPLHEQFNQRIEHLNNSLQSLERELFASAADQDPDQPVQEGNDVPELLEQLTQLKWLFEARESLHQELFELVSLRNDAYKAIVALPYHQSGNADKIRDTEAFFDKDSATRHATFCADVLKRHETFLQIVEGNALRGIELQSSAFWDITPGLVDLMQKVPNDLNKLEIVIPEEELQENPSFNEHPSQYLWHLLQHAEKSSYQYIEGQVNLYCLVHEVKTSSLAAHYKASKAQQKMAGDQSIDLADTRLEDEGELNDELKNRASMIEEQWDDALGKYITMLKERIKRHLQDRGAWEDVAAELSL